MSSIFSDIFLLHLYHDKRAIKSGLISLTVSDSWGRWQALRGLYGLHQQISWGLRIDTEKVVGSQHCIDNSQWIQRDLLLISEELWQNSRC